MEVAFKTNRVPDPTSDQRVWHQFLSTFHTQWTAQRWPNNELAAMTLESLLGRNIITKRAKGLILKQYVEYLNYSLANNQALRQVNKSINYTLLPNMRLSTHWANFFTLSSDEQGGNLPMEGTSYMREMFEQKVQASPYHMAWSNVSMEHSILPDGSNWLDFIKHCDANHEAPPIARAPTPSPIPSAASSSSLVGLNIMDPLSLNTLDPLSREYQAAERTLSKFRRCTACGGEHEPTACPRVAALHRAEPDFYKQWDPDRATTHVCACHGHNFSHTSSTCKTLSKLNTPKWEEVIRNMRKPPPRDQRDYHYHRGDQGKNSQKRDKHERSGGRDKSPRQDSHNSDIKKLMEGNKELQTSINTLINTLNPSQTVQYVEDIDEDEPSTAQPPKKKRRFVFRKK
jgi:hypothetical protein